MKRLFILAAALAMLGLAACGSLGSPKEVEYTIELTEFAYNPETIELKVGQQVTLHLVNPGALEHEVMFGREVLMKDGHPNGYHTDLFEAAGVEPVVHLKGASLAAGASEHGHDEDMDEHADEMEAGHSEDDGGHGHDDDVAADHHDEMADDHAHSGFTVVLPERTEGYSIEFTVTEDMVGEWGIGCFLQAGSHYESGMVGKLIITN